MHAGRSLWERKDAGGKAMKRKQSLMAVLCLMALVLSGCGAVEFVKEKINARIESYVVGETEAVTSISEDRLAYQQLSDEEKQVYDQILDCILKHKEKIPVSTKNADVLQRAYDGMLADYGGLFWISGYQYNTYTGMEQIIGIEFLPNYIYSAEETAELQAQVDAVVEEWLSGIGKNDSDYAKSKYVFEKLIDEVEYDAASENNQNILSVFLGKRTVCQGYANATQYLLEQLGIRSMIVLGEANGEAHAWNLVVLDGEYYMTDTTWGNSRYLLRDNTIQKQIDYHYLNATTEDLAQTHTIRMNFTIPECTATKNNVNYQ